MVDKAKVDKLVAYIVNCDVFEIVGESSWLHGAQWDSPATGDPENQVLLINYVGEYSLILTEQGLSDARVEGNRIFCLDHEGNDIEIAVWKTEPLEINY